MTCVTCSRSTVSMNACASNFSCSTYVQPRNHAGMSVTNAPLNTSEPAWKTTLSGVKRNCDAKSVQYMPRT